MKKEEFERLNYEIVKLRKLIGLLLYCQFGLDPRYVDGYSITATDEEKISNEYSRESFFLSEEIKETKKFKKYNKDRKKEIKELKQQLKNYLKEFNEDLKKQE